MSKLSVKHQHITTNTNMFHIQGQDQSSSIDQNIIHQHQWIPFCLKHQCSVEKPQIILTNTTITYKTPNFPNEPTFIKPKH